MKSGIVARIDLVFVGENDLISLYQQGSKGLVAMFCCQLGQTDATAMNCSSFVIVVVPYQESFLCEEKPKDVSAGYWMTLSVRL